MSQSYVTDFLAEWFFITVLVAGLISIVGLVTFRSAHVYRNRGKFAAILILIHCVGCVLIVQKASQLCAQVDLSNLATVAIVVFSVIITSAIVFFVPWKSWLGVINFVGTMYDLNNQLDELNDELKQMAEKEALPKNAEDPYEEL